MQYGLSLMFTKVFVGWDVGACHNFPDCRVFAAAEFVLLIVCRSQVLVPSFCLCSKSACCFFLRQQVCIIKLCTMICHVAVAVLTTHDCCWRQQAFHV